MNSMRMRKPKKMKKSKGFTLVELVIVIVIVGILAIVAVPIYRGYVRRAIASEGKTLMGSIQTAQKIYFAESVAFYGPADVSGGYDSNLDVDARTGKYFTAFKITGADASGFTASATASGNAGITVSLTGSATGQATMEESGLF